MTRDPEHVGDPIHGRCAVERDSSHVFRYTGIRKDASAAQCQRTVCARSTNISPISGHLWGHGLNNVLQEAIVMGYLAHLAGRVYVFEDYVWSHSPLPYTIYDFALRATRIPLNAFVTGPLAGGQLDQNAAHKRAVSAAFYEKVCPRSAIRTVLVRGLPDKRRGVCAASKSTPPSSPHSTDFSLAPHGSSPSPPSLRRVAEMNIRPPINPTHQIQKA
ncbi:hypothetical protein C8R43DRAFT_1245318 [Mycena crocata]|nr:hypothetical protein C8R43DRAFT_1245318 [Mycena crocata]